MYTVTHIQNFDPPDLAPYQSMRMQEEHWRQRIFVAEGEKVVRRLLQSPLTVLSVLLPEKWFHVLEPLIALRPETVQVFLAEKQLLETLTGYSMYQGVLAVGRMPKPWNLEQLLAATPSPRLFAAVDGLANAENLGALVRNCAAFGVQGILVGETSGSPYLRRAVRGSMGTVFQMPVLETNDLVYTLNLLRRNGIRSLAAHPHTDQVALPQSRLDGDVCIVFGSEGHGISKPVLQACDEAAAVPMPAHIDSLNVGSAAAVFLYEANRQRGHYASAQKPLPWTTPDPTQP
jgi:tRNA G18 (ribose-2'-O)-methylase SpoU